MENKVRRIIGIILFLVIIFFSIMVIINRDTVFKQVINVTYPDQCVETYTNGVLSSDECIEGRRIYEEQNKKHIIYGTDMTDLFEGNIMTNISGGIDE